ncbi:helix-turn-helix transcriptional regulator [Caulobacter sp. FWC2]|uniref:helix-turn-helix transcriptional regulator n=1 Tax=Caulobacter sp. FWC2 TaxID=69664 RepID=UPI00130422A7|nr:helix-turn-helix transcriptional regulator [Caulobacter sp. FWC2]
MTDHKLTDAKLAEMVGVTQPHIWRIRKRKARPSPDVAKRIEGVTGIPASELVFVDVAR